MSARVARVIVPVALPEVAAVLIPVIKEAPLAVELRCWNIKLHVIYKREVADYQANVIGETLAIALLVMERWLFDVHGLRPQYVDSIQPFSVYEVPNVVTLAAPLPVVLGR